MRNGKQRKEKRKRDSKRLVNCFVDWSVPRTWSAGLMDDVEDVCEEWLVGSTNKVQSRHSAEERRRDLAALSLQHPLESNYRPTNLITASEGAGARTDAGRDGWRGNKHCRSFNNSQWVSTAGHWCYSATFYSRVGVSPRSPLIPSSSSYYGIRKRTGRLQRGHNADHQVLSRKVA